MRDILFRAKCKDNGEWVEGYYARKGWTDIGYVVERVEVIGNVHDNLELLQD
jgi:hypothetical protein